MIFSVGIELPIDDINPVFGMHIPVMYSETSECHLIAETEIEMKLKITEAITWFLEEKIGQGYSIDSIKDLGVVHYRSDPEFSHCGAWMMVDIDISAYQGKQKRINISLQDTLIRRIDDRVKANPEIYRDRSHFLAVAAHKELQVWARDSAVLLGNEIATLPDMMKAQIQD